MSTVAVDWVAKCIGATLGATLGDALGAAFEGMDGASIAKSHPTGVRDFIAASHMGVYFLPPRSGCYTDDVNSAAAILSSLAEHKKIWAAHIAYTHARHWHDGFALPPLRGYPDSAQSMMVATLDQKLSARECATLAFPDGSFANGGAMKIFPMAFAFPNGVTAAADVSRFADACTAACAYSHVHPDGVAAAILQAHAVRLAASLPPSSELDAAFLAELQGFCTSARMSQVISALRRVQEQPDVLPGIVDPATSTISWPPLRTLAVELCGRQHAGFQIEGPGAVGCAIAAALVGQRDVMKTIAVAVAFGGDTDTIASMAGAISGALVGGTAWCPDALFAGLENGLRGREWLLQQTSVVATEAVRRGDSVVEVDLGTPYLATAVDKASVACAAYFKQLPLKHGIKLVNTTSGRKRLPGFDDLVTLTFDTVQPMSRESAERLLPLVSGLDPVVHHARLQAALDAAQQQGWSLDTWRHSVTQLCA